jgi:hypothetical protein
MNPHLMQDYIERTLLDQRLVPIYHCEFDALAPKTYSEQNIIPHK